MMSLSLKPGRAVAGASNNIYQPFLKLILYEIPSRGTQEVCLYILASFSILTYSSRLNHIS